MYAALMPSLHSLRHTDEIYLRHSQPPNLLEYPPVDIIVR